MAAGRAPGPPLAGRPARRRGGAGDRPSRFAVTWRARRRYPRGAPRRDPDRRDDRGPVPSMTSATSVRSDLEWSHRIVGARRAALEEFSPWKAGPGRVAFAIIPDDFPTNGPHRLVLQSRVRTGGLSELLGDRAAARPVPVRVRPDPPARRDPDPLRRGPGRGDGAGHPAGAGRASMSDEPAGSPAAGRRVGPAESAAPGGDDALPCDLAHAVAIEFDGTPGRFPAGSLDRERPGPAAARSGSRATIDAAVRRRTRSPPLPARRDRSSGRPARAGAPRGRSPARLGRSRYPLGLAGAIETNWVEAEIIRR